MESDAVTRVILVRHGQTIWNDGARFQGHMDSPLTEEGVRQVEALGKRLAPENVSAVYSSDLGRAMQTAEIIAGRTKHRVISDTRLREQCLGIFEGLSKDEIPKRYPEEWKRYHSRDPEYVVPGGESPRGRFELGLACLSELALRHRGENIVVVTHGGLVQGMFRHVVGVPFREARRFSIQNAAYNVFLHHEEGWSVQTWGDVSHVREMAENQVKLSGASERMRGHTS